MSFKLQANPTFKAPVNIPVPGEPPEKVLFTFRHRTRPQFDALIKSMINSEKTLDQIIQDVVVEWTYPGVDFNDDALIQCLEMFPGSAQAIFTAYRENLMEARQKN